MRSITGNSPEGIVAMDTRTVSSTRPVESLSRYESAASMLARARTLRIQARRVNPVLADAYLRRAAELSLEAWARAVHHEPVEIDTVHAATAAA
jgi:hypothetical protein